MKRGLLVTLSFTILIGAGIFLGCSDDDKATDPGTQKPLGSNSDPALQGSSRIFENVNDEIISTLGDALEGLSVFSTAAARKGGDRIALEIAVDTFEWHAGSQFWYIDSTAQDTIYSDLEVIDDIATVTRRDSVQFYHGTEIVQFPDPAMLTRVVIGSHKKAVSLLHEDSITVGTDFDVTGAPGEIVAGGDVVINFGTTVDGTRTDFHEDDDQFLCDVTLDWAVSGQNLVANLYALTGELGCPTGGTLTHGGTLDLFCEGPATIDFAGAWTATTTFNGELITHVVENATTRWVVQDTCSSGITAPSLWRNHPVSK